MGQESIERNDVRVTDDLFFACLQRADTERLAELLTADFVLVDVMRGGLVARAALLDAVGSRQIRFDAIDVVESDVRRYGAAAIVVGRTRMRGRAGDNEWSASSRYTHVYVQEAGRWQLASAQGTPIADDP